MDKEKIMELCGCNEETAILVARILEEDGADPIRVCQEIIGGG